jgi:hypothetical protein
VDEAAFLLRGFFGRLDHGEAAFAADRFACGELRALLLEPSRLFVAPCLLALFPLGLLCGVVLLDRGRGHPLGELREDGGAGQFLRLVDVITGLTGASVIEGSKKIVSALGKEGAMFVALLLAGAAYLYWRSEPGSRLRTGMAALARDVGPPLLEAVAERSSLSEKIAALAIQPATERPSAFRFVAQRLATGQTTMTTTDIARLLSESGYRFATDGNCGSLVRPWLVANPCFFELQRGHWSLGYHALPPGAQAA